MKTNIIQHKRNNNNAMNVFISLLVGSLTGAVVMLLFSPKSGRQIRDLIYQRGVQVGNQILDRVSAAFEIENFQIDSI